MQIRCFSLSLAAHCVKAFVLLPLSRRGRRPVRKSHESATSLAVVVAVVVVVVAKRALVCPTDLRA